MNRRYTNNLSRAKGGLPAGPLLFRRDSQSLHLPVKVAALQAQHLGGAADVAMVLVERLEDVVALIGVARLVQRGELSFRSPPAAFAIDQWRQVFAVKSCSRWIHDHDARK